MDKTEVELCENIFKENIKIENEKISINTPYGKMILSFPQNYPSVIPKIEVTNAFNTCTKNTEKFLIEKAQKLQGNFMIYPLVVNFYDHHEQFRENKRRPETSHVFETSYEVVEDNDLKMSEKDFMEWIQQNKLSTISKEGLTGKQYFYNLKKEAKNENILNEDF